MDARIILGGRSPDVVGQIARGNAARGQQNDIQYQQNFRNALREFGAGALQGDQNARNQLAGYDPGMVQGLEAGQLNMDNVRQQMSMRMRQEVARMSQAEADAQLNQDMQIATQALNLYQAGNTQGAVDLLSQNGVPVASADVEGALGVLYPSLQETIDWNRSRREGPELPAGFQSLQLRAQQAGLQPGTPEYQAFMVQGGQPKDGFSVVTPDGTRVNYGDTSAQSQETPLQPSSPSAMLSTIDGLLGDEAFDTSTGFLSFLQAVPGTPQYRFGTRVRQLNGQAFLQAFESLKGGGQITEIEGTKATEAIGRLDSAQSPKDYRDALQELRGVLALGISRPVGWVETQRGQVEVAEPIAPEQLQAMPPEQIMQMSREDMLRITTAPGMNLSDEQWDALERRAQELEQQ